MAIGECELQRFDDRVDVIGAVVPERFQIVAGSDLERLRQHRPLAPRPARTIEPRKLRSRWIFESNLESGEVVLAQQTVVLGGHFHDGGRDVAAIERRTRGFESRVASRSRMRSFLIHHVLKTPSEIALHEQLAFVRRPTLRQEDFDARGPAAIAFLVLADVIGHERVHGEAVARQSYGGGRDVPKLIVPAFESSDPGIGCSWDDRAQDARRHFAAMMLHEKIRSHCPRPGAEPVDVDDFVALGDVDHHRCNACEVHAVGLQHADGNAGGDTRIDCIAAGFSILKPACAAA